MISSIIKGISSFMYLFTSIIFAFFSVGSFSLANDYFFVSEEVEPKSKPVTGAFGHGNDYVKSLSSNAALAFFKARPSLAKKVRVFARTSIAREMHDMKILDPYSALLGSGFSPQAALTFTHEYTGNSAWFWKNLARYCAPEDNHELFLVEFGSADKDCYRYSDYSGWIILEEGTGQLVHQILVDSHGKEVRLRDISSEVRDQPEGNEKPAQKDISKALDTADKNWKIHPSSATKMFIDRNGELRPAIRCLALSSPQREDAEALNILRYRVKKQNYEEDSVTACLCPYKTETKLWHEILNNYIKQNNGQIYIFSAQNQEFSSHGFIVLHRKTGELQWQDIMGNNKPELK